jgi:hypothetical protein
MEIFILQILSAKFINKFPKGHLQANFAGKIYNSLIQNLLHDSGVRNTNTALQNL